MQEESKESQTPEQPQAGTESASPPTPVLENIENPETPLSQPEATEINVPAEQESTSSPAEPVEITESAPAGVEEADEDGEPDDEPEDVEEPVEIEATLETVIEAVLFASDEPLSPKKLVEIAEAGSVKDIKAAVKSLNKKYKQSNHSFRVEKISGGFQMMTLSAYNPWISKLIKVRSDNKLSPAALETLAIVSYKQPIIRADIEAIRGVASGEVLRSLMFKGLVKIVGRAEILGRPMLYGTTKKFLDVFGLASLKDLPKIEELKNPEKG
jgi:segregation and condensation protein B